MAVLSRDEKPAAGAVSVNYWPAKYVGTTFDNCDANGGAHCWGLVCRVFKDQRLIDLPRYSELSADDMAGMARSVHEATAQDGPWSKVERGSEREFDVAVMMGWVDVDGCKRRHPIHVGILTPDRLLLHVERATAAVIVPLSHPTVRFRYFASYRYEKF